MTLKRVLVLALTCLSLNVHALGPFHLEPFVAGGIGTAEVDGESSSPDMFYYQLGGTAGYHFIPLFYVGASASMYAINQSSSTNADYGNRKGSRFDIAPTVGFKFMGIHAKYELKMFGNYKLSKKTSSGDELSYESPMGHRLSAQYSVFANLYAGLYYETISFDKEIQGSTERTLTNEMTLKNYGLVLSMHF